MRRSQLGGIGWSDMENINIVQLFPTITYTLGNQEESQEIQDLAFCN